MDFSLLDTYFDSLPARGLPTGELVITYGGRLVYRRRVGDAREWPEGAPAPLYWVCSISKITTCVAAMRLVESGRLDLNAPVSDYLPEFAGLLVKGKTANDPPFPAKNIMTVRHLFTMTSGLDYKVKGAEDICALQAENPSATTRDYMTLLSKRPLNFEPGTRYLYSMSHDLLAAVCEVVTGKRFADYVKEVILDPLGMTDTGFHPTDEQLARFAKMYRYTNGLFRSTEIPCENPYVFGENYDSGGAGLFTTPDDQIKLLTVLACGGTTADGYTLLSPASIARMGKKLLPDSALPDFQPSSRAAGYGWGLCGRAHINPLLSSSPSAVGEFGWDGATAGYGLVDPTNRIAIAFASHVFGCQYSYYHVHPTLRNLAYRAILGIESLYV